MKELLIKSSGDYFEALRNIPVEPIFWLITFYIMARVLFKAFLEGYNRDK